MNTTELLNRIEGLGGRLTIFEDQVQVWAPKGALTDALKKEIRRLKPDLVRLEKWDVREIKIPNQTDPRLLDVWICGSRTEGVDAWWLRFVWTRQREGGSDP